MPSLGATELIVILCCLLMFVPLVVIGISYLIIRLLRKSSEDNKQPESIEIEESKDA